MFKRLSKMTIVICAIAVITISQSAYAQPEELVLWNRLGSISEVGNSEVGPDIQLTSYRFPDWYEAQIVPAKFGNGLFINHDIWEGWKNDGGNFFAANVNDTGLTPIQGCIEFWFKFRYGSNVYNHTFFFANRNKLAGHFPDPNVSTYVIMQAGWGGWYRYPDGRLGKFFFFGMGNSTYPSYVPAETPRGSAGPGGNLEFHDGTMFHFAFVWDLNGIDGTSDTLRIYVDGNLEGSATGQWIPTGGLDPYLYLGAAPNYGPWWDHYYNAVKGVTDNIKIWNYAKTDFSDRFAEIPVAIDIKPGSEPNSINLGSNGVFPVAILSSEDFDATQANPGTVSLAGAGVAVRGKSSKPLAHEADVNKDGHLDLVVQVETEDLDPDQLQDGLACLTGETYGGESFAGFDEIRIVPPEAKPGPSLNPRRKLVETWAGVKSRY